MSDEELLDEAVDDSSDGGDAPEPAPVVEPVEVPPLTYAAPTVEETPSHTRGDGSDATKPIANPGHHGVNPGRHADQYPQ